MKLYEFGPSRSARCRWAMRELGVEYESVSARDLIGSDELKKVHPRGKIPALLNDQGQPLFESAAICNYLADQHPERDLIAKPGTWERALHDQWCFYAISEIEAPLWNNAQHTKLFPQERRVPQIVDSNKKEAWAGLSIVDEALSESEYLLGNRFSMCDIVVSYSINWGRLAGLIGDFNHLNRYLDKLYTREHCTLSK